METSENIDFDIFRKYRKGDVIRLLTLAEFQRYFSARGSSGDEEYPSALELEVPFGINSNMLNLSEKGIELRIREVVNMRPGGMDVMYHNFTPQYKKIITSGLEKGKDVFFKTLVLELHKAGDADKEKLEHLLKIYNYNTFMIARVSTEEAPDLFKVESSIENLEELV